MAKIVSSFELTLNPRPTVKHLRVGFMQNCVWRFLRDGLRRARGCLPRGILPASMAFRAEQLSVPLNVCRRRNMYSAVSAWVRG